MKGSTAPVSGWTGLAEPLTETVGRTLVIDDTVDRIIHHGARLVTLSGSPGIGKSRVAVEVARRLPGPVWYVSLERVKSAQLVDRLLARAPVDASGRTYLILDDPDHLEIASVLEKYLGVRSQTTLVVARRAPTGAYGEVEVSIPPLAGPDDDAEHPGPSIAPAEALLASRATAAGSTWDPTDAEVRALCHTLDGIPLAIELAAARARSLSPSQIRQAMSSSIRILDPPVQMPGRGGLASRLAWSYDQLIAEDRHLVRQLSVFEGPVRLFNLEAVATQASATPDPAAGVDFLNAVERLIRAGFLYRPAHAERVQLLNPIRIFLRERLAETGEASVAYRSHATYYLKSAEQAHYRISSGDQLSALEDLSDPNVSAALRRLMNSPDDESAEDALALAGAVAPLWQLRGTWSAGLGVLRQALERRTTGRTDVRARAQFGAAGLALSLNHFDEATSLLTEAIQDYETSGSLTEIAHGLNLLGALQSRNGSHSLAMETIGRALAIMRRVDDTRGTALVINNLGLVATARGQHGRAARYFEDALRLLQGTSDQRAAAWAMINLGDATWDRGDLKRAAALYDASSEIGAALGGRSIVAACLDGLAAIAAGAEHQEESALLLGAADGIRESLGGTAPRYRASSRERVQRIVRSGLGDSRYRELRLAGRRMSYEEAISFSRAAPEVAELAGSAALADPVRFSPANLTRREREVVEHLAHGLTNREISRALGIAPGTAARHVENILGKLGLRTRAQVTAWAHETGVVGELTPQN